MPLPGTAVVVKDSMVLRLAPWDGTLPDLDVVQVIRGMQVYTFNFGEFSAQFPSNVVCAIFIVEA